jgi:hypothetical protein
MGLLYFTLHLISLSAVVQGWTGVAGASILEQHNTFLHNNTVPAVILLGGK